VVQFCLSPGNLLSMAVLRVTFNTAWIRIIFTWLVLSDPTLSCSPGLTCPWLVWLSACRENKLFRMWCTATCRQRINTMVLTPYDLFSWNKHNIKLPQFYTQFMYTNYKSSSRKNSSLCSCWSFFITTESMLPLRSLRTECWSSLLPGGPGPASPPPPSWPHFPQVPGNALSHVGHSIN
jgi:hypothetical protein